MRNERHKKDLGNFSYSWFAGCSFSSCCCCFLGLAFELTVYPCPAAVICPLSCWAIVLLSVMWISSVDDDDDVDDSIKKNCQLCYTHNLLTIIMVYFRNDARIYLISMCDLYYEYLIIKLLFIPIWMVDRRI